MLKEFSFYFVTGGESPEERTIAETAARAIEGGADIVQLREKNMGRGELVGKGGELSRLCRAKNVTFIVNDDPYLASEISADGVHLGQEDILKYPVKKAREILGDEKIIGLSTHSLEQVEEANRLDVDYIGFGPVFPTRAKNYHLGTGNVLKVLEISEKPVFFIGGINLSNAGSLLEMGAKNIAAIRAVAGARDIEGRVREFKAMLKVYKTRRESETGSQL